MYMILIAGKFDVWRYVRQYSQRGTDNGGVSGCHTVHAVIQVSPCRLYTSVNAYRNSQLDIVDTCVGGNEVDEDFTVSDAEILGVEVSFVTRIGIDLSLIHILSAAISYFLIASVRMAFSLYKSPI